MVAISYKTRQLERACLDEREMKRRYESQVAKGIKLRHTELRAAGTVDDLLHGPGRWEVLTGDRAGQWSGRLTGNWRFIIEPTNSDGSEVLVSEIVDYHQ